MNPDQQIELYRAARSIAWSYRLQDYTAAALKDLQRIVDKSKESIINRFENQLGAIQREGSYTRSHYENSLAELERLSIALQNQLGEQLTTSTSRIGSLALKEWGENLSVGGVAKRVNTVALSPEQFAAFFKRNPPAGILIPKVMRNALDQDVTARIEGELLDVLREGALTGQSYKRIVDKLSESFTDFNRHQLVTLTRTFFQTANAQAFDAVYQANQDIMEGKIWTNVNDDRVCILCLPLGEVLYKKGEFHPPMPRHPNCRCVFRAKTVSYRSLGIDVDELEEVAAPVVTRGYEKNGKWIIPPVGTGAGRGPRSVSFYKGGMKEAFPNLPEAQQKAMLGVGRYNLYKAGDLTIDQLVDPVSGKLYLLKEIEQGMHLRVPDDGSKIVRKFDNGSFFQSSYIDELSNLSDSELREHPLWGRITRDIRDDDTYSDSTLAEILKIQGFDNLPDVVDTIVDSPGSLTMYRGVTGYKTADGLQVTAKDALEQFRSGKVFPGLGIYGNGTYAVYGEDAYRIASEYAGGNTVGIVKMQFKPGSKIISYDDLQALDTPDFAAKVSGVREIQDKMYLHRRNDEPPSGLSNDERSEWRSAWRKKEQELMKERDKRERVARYVSNIRDYGQKAALLGYDSIDCGTRNPYYVILNRSAIRIEAP